MGKQWIPTQEAFDKLLEWLDKDRERAGRKYEEIRLTLVKFFAWRGCTDAEDMADETINRVNRRVEELTEIYEGDPSRYFFGVAKNLVKEWRRQEHPQPLSPSTPAPAQVETAPVDDSLRLRECLEQCLQSLPGAERELVLNYYEKSKQAKIDFRKLLAQSLEVESTALRVRVHRIRAKIQKCVERCLDRETHE